MNEAPSDEPPDTGEASTRKRIAHDVRATLAVVLLLALITGAVFPAIVLGVAQVAFPNNADGSLVRNAQGQIVGSELIGQDFSSPEYFHPRPSAAGADGYDASSSSGLNLGPNNEKLAETIDERAQAYRSENGLADDVLLPADAVTTSASGLDPHISAANAFLQVKRVAQARRMSEEAVRELVQRLIDGKTLGFFGEPRVNVLLLNIALDEAK